MTNNTVNFQALRQASPLPRREDGPTPAPTPSPAPEPQPAPPIDFSTIDSGQKAALVPALQPGVLLATMNGMANATSYGAAFSGSLTSTVEGGTANQLLYSTANGPANTAQVQAQGSFAGQPTQETWTLDALGLHIKGNLGTNAEALDVLQTPTGLSITGTIGTVAVQETVTPTVDGGGAIFDGFLGQEPIHEELTQTTDAGGNPFLHLGGHVGTSGVLFDESTLSPTTSGLLMQGEGMIGGIPTTFQHEVDITLPQPPPAKA